MRLGITEDAVRKRIKTGTLSGRKVGRTWIVYLDGLQKPSRNGSARSELLTKQLQADMAFLQSQLVAKDQHLSEWEQQFREQLVAKDEQLSRKDEQIRKLQEDVEGWREQVRYKELQIAQLQDRMIQLPSPEEAEPTEQGSEVPERAVPQTAASGNVVSRFWRWFVGG
jgi:hypothetical protein